LKSLRSAAAAVPSGRKATAIEPAPAPEHFAPALGGHARAKAVTSLADELARLVGAFHDNVSIRTFLR
jgi:hypothetical protein